VFIGRYDAYSIVSDCVFEDCVLLNSLMLFRASVNRSSVTMTGSKRFDCRTKGRPRRQATSCSNETKCSTWPSAFLSGRQSISAAYFAPSLASGRGQ
jgi:hypothetical protein